MKKVAGLLLIIAIAIGLYQYLPPDGDLRRIALWLYALVALPVGLTLAWKFLVGIWRAIVFLTTAWR